MPDPIAKEGLRVVLEPIPGVTGKAAFDVVPWYIFQCPPLEEFAYEEGFSYGDYDTVSAGQFSRKGGPTLTTISFDTLIVDSGSYTLYDQSKTGAWVPDPETQIDALRSIRAAGEPFLLTAAHQLPPLGYDSWSLTQIGPEVQMPATLRTLRVSEKAGEGDARYISASFTEHRETVVGRKRARRGKAARHLTPDRPVLRANGLAYDKRGVRIGSPPEDPVTLGRLARHYYKDEQQWRKLAAANGLANWGKTYALILHPKYRSKGGRIAVPK